MANPTERSHASEILETLKVIFVSNESVDLK